MDEFGRPEKDPDILSDMLLLDGDWVDDVFTYEIHAEGHDIKFETFGHRCEITIIDKDSVYSNKKKHSNQQEVR